MFIPGSGGDGAPPPQPAACDVERDLGTQAPAAAAIAVAGPVVVEPPAMDEAKFKQTYPSADAMTVVTLSMNGGNIQCTIVDNKVFISSVNKMTIPGATTPGAKPLFLYAGGTWISEDAKAGHVKMFVVTLPPMRIGTLP